MSTTTGDSAVQPLIVAARAPAEGSHEVRQSLRARHADLRIIGAFVAGADDYFDQLGTLGHVISALLAILLWPLVLLGIDFQVR